MKLNKTNICLFFVLIFILIEILMFSFGCKISVNISPSLPYKVFFVNKSKNKINNIKNGDFIQFINKDAKYYNGVKITKQVLAKSGDNLVINLFDEINNNIQGTIIYKDKTLNVKYKTSKGTRVYINDISTLPKDKYFVVGYDENSFDSRYKEFGLIDKKEVIGVAKPLF